jgi:hypothetical protein
MSRANEPAFPLDGHITPISDGPEGFKCRGPSGLTLREYFAAKAMQGLLASTSNADMVEALTQMSRARGLRNPQLLAAMAVQQADDLLAELAKEKS